LQAERAAQPPTRCRHSRNPKFQRQKRIPGHSLSGNQVAKHRRRGSQTRQKTPTKQNWSVKHRRWTMAQSMGNQRPPPRMLMNRDFVLQNVRSPIVPRLLTVAVFFNLTLPWPLSRQVRPAASIVNCLRGLWKCAPMNLKCEI
jgi:hypothetical protein